MILNELVYQIDGYLKNSFNPDNTRKVVLMDNIHEPAIVRIVSSREEVEAAATGATLEEAKTNLATLLRGNILKHDWPAMWTSTTAMLRIPETLTA